MKKYILELFDKTGDLVPEDIILNLLMSAVIGFLIFLSYRLSHNNNLYSKKFNVSLVVMTVLTTTVMTVIGNNIALSLGMVGALSIVRFRTAIKDSRDTVYIFWTVIVGICCGVGDYLVASAGSVLVFILLLIYGSYNEQEVLGMEPHYEWALHGPYMDKSLIRNYMWYNIAGEIMDWAPNVRFCEVIVNGEYQGLYLMTETITSGKESRLKLTEPMQDANKTGFVVRLDRGSSNPLKNINTFTQYAYRNLQKMDIKYPRAGDLTPELARAISQEVSDFEKTLYSYDYDTDDYGYWHSIDTDSFVDFFILNEFTANYDAGWLSTYLYKDVGGKYKMVIWDFNSACENYRHLTSSPQHIELQYNIWYYMLTKDEYFNKKILRRYKELREDVLSDEFLIRYIDETVAYLGDVIERNFAVWGDSFDKDMLEPSERNPRSYQEAVDQMKRFIQERGDWLDNHLEIILQYSHESKIKKFNH